MSDRNQLPKRIDAIIRAVEDAATKDEERASTFARGLALGLLVGAAIAGSTIWQRRLAGNTRRRAPSTTGPATPEPRPGVDRPT